MDADPTLRLSKSRFVTGLQCPKLLWWRVHEPDADELKPDLVLQDRFDQGQEVGLLATALFPDGTLIDLPHDAVEERLERTFQAIAEGAPAIFEATFVESDTFVAVDVLERVAGGFHLIEVKSSTKQKPEHIPDVAVQLHVVREAGVDVTRASVMHLNPGYRHPGVGDLFSLTDVTSEAEDFQREVEVEISSQMEMLRGSLPEVEIGRHCYKPRACPFLDRCWPKDRDHIIRLYNVGPAKAAKYMAEGIHSVWDLPESQSLPAAAERQLEALREDRMIVDPGLAEALGEFTGKLGFLDFETLARAIPVWPGLGPWIAAPAQFSYHEELPDGGHSHVGWLAEGPEDARPEFVRRMIEATQEADAVVVYSSYEKTQIRALQDSLPEFQDELIDLELKLVDLLPIVRGYVYHPDFGGSFSIKYVLQPLVDELSYDDLTVADGLAASVQIARLLLGQDLSDDEKKKSRQDLLAYCERDTWAMVKLLEALRGLAEG